jgi:hypothetical protein
MITTTNNRIVKQLLNFGFKQVATNKFNFEITGNESLFESFSITIVTDYRPGTHWVQFEENKVYNSDNILSDAYCQTFNEIIIAFTEYVYRQAILKEQDRIKAVLGL